MDVLEKTVVFRNYWKDLIFHLLGLGLLNVKKHLINMKPHWSLTNKVLLQYPTS
nr:hypothetical protein Iba_chr05bCG5970 [Ipomoea batatas]